MARMQHQIDELRGRFRRLRGTRYVVDIAKELGLSPDTVYAFGRGEHVGERSLLAIDAWCARQASQKAPGVHLVTTQGDGYVD